MSKSARLRLADHRALWELVNECRGLGDDVTAWRQHLAAGVSRLTGDGLVVAGEVNTRGGQILGIGTVEHGWENGFSRKAFHRALQTYSGRLEISPVMTAYFRRPAGADGACLCRPELVTDQEWYPTPYFELIAETIGHDHAILSFTEIPGRPGAKSGLNIIRCRTVRRDFSDRERAIVAEAQRLTGALVGGALARFTEPSPSELAPRVRAVLACLLDGDSDKQVAARLRLSTYTVNQYVKAIFKHFGVSSRPELLARWVRRGWGNKGGWRAE